MTSTQQPAIDISSITRADINGVTLSILYSIAPEVDPVYIFALVERNISRFRLHEMESYLGGYLYPPRLGEPRRVDVFPTILQPAQAELGRQQESGGSLGEPWTTEQRTIQPPTEMPPASAHLDLLVLAIKVANDRSRHAWGRERECRKRLEDARKREAEYLEQRGRSEADSAERVFEMRGGPYLTHIRKTQEGHGPAEERARRQARAEQALGQARYCDELLEATKSRYMLASSST